MDIVSTATGIGLFAGSILPKKNKIAAESVKDIPGNAFHDPRTIDLSRAAGGYGAIAQFSASYCLRVADQSSCGPR